MDQDEFRRVINKLRMKHDKTVVDFGKNLGCYPPGSVIYTEPLDKIILQSRQTGKSITSTAQLMKEHIELQMARLTQDIIEEALANEELYAVKPDIIIEFSL